MWYKILRFFGAIIAAYIFFYLVEWACFSIFLKYINQVTDYVWADWFKLSSLVISVGVTSIVAVGIVLCNLVRGNIWLAILPILYFIDRLISLFNVFINTDIVANFVSQKVDDVPESLYNFGLTITFALILFSCVFCSLKMIKWKE